MAVAEGVPVVASRPPTRPRCWASTARCSWPTWSALPAPPGRGADGSRRAPGRPGALRPARHADLRQDVEIDVGCVFEGTVTLGDGVRIGAHCVIRDAHIGRRGDPPLHAHRRRPRAGSAAGAGRPVRTAAPRRRAGPRGAHRQLRRGEELHAGQGRQGQPPGLPGRRHGGRARQLRRRQHHRQLRRRQQAPHRDRRRRAHRQQLRAGGAGDHRRRRDHRRRLDDQQEHARPAS
jgi:hypothetical protein